LDFVHFALVGARVKNVIYKTCLDNLLEMETVSIGHLQLVHIAPDLMELQ
jgi:hypothetical protein